MLQLLFFLFISPVSYYYNGKRKLGKAIKPAMEPVMIITVAKSAGFCFGVKRAIKIALETVGKGGRVEMLGDIVHNEQVVREVEAAGIHKVDSLDAGKGKTLLIRSHGAPESVYHEARQLGYRIVDATCPMVKEIHTIVRDRYAQGFSIIIIGDKQHDEVQGILGQVAHDALVIEHADTVPLDAIQGIERAAVVVQSTQTLANVRAILDVLEKHIPEIVFSNTICRATRERQAEMERLPLENDVVLVIGSKTSANTKRLYELALAANERSYLIQTRDDIMPEWFSGASRVAVTAGASTPDQTIREVIEALRALPVC
jgi:(E)-4-hydroxy-3-methyl-but-2-enyl pyrophosphate reductase